MSAEKTSDSEIQKITGGEDKQIEEQKITRKENK